MEDTNKMSRSEAIALRDFVEERFETLYPCPRFFGKAKWNDMMLQFEYDFLDALTKRGERGDFWGAIWRFFETTDSIFIGTNGMKELADHTYFKDGSWIYRGNGTERVIYTVPMEKK